MIRASFLLVAFLPVVGLGLHAQEEKEPPEAETQEEAEPALSFLYEKGKIYKDGLVTKFYRVGHSHSPHIKTHLERWLTPGKGWIDVGAKPAGKDKEEQLHYIIITDTPENMPLLEQVLEIIDGPDAQVMLEALVVETTIVDDYEWSMEASWDRNIAHWIRTLTQRFEPVDSLSTDSIRIEAETDELKGGRAHFGDFEAAVEILHLEGLAKIISQPSILVMNGERAEIHVGQEVPVQTTTVKNNNLITSTEWKKPGIKLIVTPNIVGTDHVEMQIEAEVSRVIRFEETALAGETVVIRNPIMETRKATTKVVLPDGHPLTIGGLISSVDSDDETGIPLLKDIPVLGYLFKSKQVVRRETILTYVLRPVIVTDPATQRLLAPRPPVPPEEEPE